MVEQVRNVSKMRGKGKWGFKMLVDHHDPEMQCQAFVLPNPTLCDTWIEDIKKVVQSESKPEEVQSYFGRFEKDLKAHSSDDALLSASAHSQLGTRSHTHSPRQIAPGQKAAGLGYSADSTTLEKALARARTSGPHPSDEGPVDLNSLSGFFARRISTAALTHSTPGGITSVNLEDPVEEAPEIPPKQPQRDSAECRMLKSLPLETSHSVTFVSMPGKFGTPVFDPEPQQKATGPIQAQSAPFVSAAKSKGAIRFLDKSEWEDDSMRDQCPDCWKTFSLFNRKHHCRICGKVKCGSCTQRKIYAAQEGLAEKRVCENCYQKVTGTSNNAPRTTS